MRFIFNTKEDIAKLNETYFGQEMPMRVLGHREALLGGTQGRNGSEWYTFRHEGGFLVNEYWFEHVGIRLPFNDFEMEVLNSAILQCMAKD